MIEVRRDTSLKEGDLLIEITVDGREMPWTVMEMGEIVKEIKTMPGTKDGKEGEYSLHFVSMV